MNQRHALPLSPLAAMRAKYANLPLWLFFNRCLMYGYIYASFLLISSARWLLWRNQIFVVVFPTVPRRPNGLWKLLRLRGVHFRQYDDGRVATQPRQDSLIVCHHPTDRPVLGSKFLTASERKRAVNGTLQSIAKDHVEDVFEAVFHRPLRVDPFQFNGMIVKKSKRNAAHDGQVLQSPITIETYDPESVYERLIENVDENGNAVDIRIAIVGNEFPLVWIKYRDQKERFKNVNTKVMMSDINKVTSVEERTLIRAFAKKMGIDFAEIDVLRDRSTGEIYIVDVNPTPHAPPSLGEGVRGIYAIYKLANAFDRQFLKRR